jgi:hypothetical protein
MRYGGPTAILPTALATSSAAIAGKAHGGKRTFHPRGNVSEALGTRKTASRGRSSRELKTPDQFLWSNLGAEVAISDSGQFPPPITQRDVYSAAAYNGGDYALMFQEVQHAASSQEGEFDTSTTTRLAEFGTPRP